MPLSGWSWVSTVPDESVTVMRTGFLEIVMRSAGVVSVSAPGASENSVAGAGQWVGMTACETSGGSFPDGVGGMHRTRAT